MTNYTVTISDIDIKCLENDLMDVDDWIQHAVVGKIYNCKERMLRQWRPILTADSEVESIPANDDALATLIFARDDYSSRAERQAAIEEEIHK